MFSTTGRLVLSAQGRSEERVETRKRVVYVQKPTKLRLGFGFWPHGNETKEQFRSKYGNFLSLAE